MKYIFTDFSFFLPIHSIPIRQDTHSVRHRALVRGILPLRPPDFDKISKKHILVPLLVPFIVVWRHFWCRFPDLVPMLSPDSSFLTPGHFCLVPHPVPFFSVWCQKWRHFGDLVPIVAPAIRQTVYIFPY